MTKDSIITTEVEVRVKTRDQSTGEMVEALCTSAKFSKNEGAEGEVREEYIYITIKPGVLPNYSDAVISITSDAKQTKGKN